jgi:hypothetical protein
MSSEGDANGLRATIAQSESAIRGTMCLAY